MKKIAFAGSFDIVTKGHLWVVQEGLNIADKVVMMVAHNPNKSSFLNEQEKVQTIEESLVELGIKDRVEVVVIKKEFTAIAAQRMGCEYMIRGIRTAGEFDYEALIQKANRDTLGGAKTIFVMAPRDLGSVSSSFVKSFMESTGWHWVIKEFVTNSVYKFLLRKYCYNQIVSLLKASLNPSEISLKNSFDYIANTVIEAYSEAHRKYHTIEHLAHGLQEVEWARYNCNNTDVPSLNFDLVGLAYVMHDIVYGQGSDEEKSAKFAIDLLFSGATEHSSGKISFLSSQLTKLILATKYGSEESIALDEEDKLLRSIDLAILGQSSAVYNWYSEAVRQEWPIPDAKFYPARLNILIQFLNLAQNTPLGLIENKEFHLKYNAQTVSNLSREIQIIQAITDTY